LWAMREYETVPVTGYWTGAPSESWQSKEVKDPRAEFVGSNWVSLAMSLYDGAGVQSDGSLWRLSWWETDGDNGEVVPVGAGNWNRKGQKMRQTPIRTTRLGVGSDWVMVAAGYSHFLALKRDGTLWGWGVNHEGQLGDGLSSSVREPVRLGADADWAFIAAFGSGSVAVKHDRSVWNWGAAFTFTSRGIGKSHISSAPQKIATLPVKVSQIVSTHFSVVFLCEDGTGWGLGQLNQNFLGTRQQFPVMTELTRLWDDGRWSVAGDDGWSGAAGIQKDGSIWLQSGAEGGQPLRGFSGLSQLGTRNDWLAIQRYGPLTVFALARDGTLCRFGDEAYTYPKFTRPTRHVTWSVNVLDSVKP
jgi:hypothetical protein